MDLVADIRRKLEITLDKITNRRLQVKLADADVKPGKLF